MSSLQNLPVELIHEIHLLATNTSFPIVSPYLHHIFSPKRVPRTIIARFFFALYDVEPSNSRFQSIVTHALPHPICTLEVLQAMERIGGTERVIGMYLKRGRGCHLAIAEYEKLEDDFDFDAERAFAISMDNLPMELPKRLFNPSKPLDPWPVLNHLFDNPKLYLINPNSHDGYPLAMAVYRLDFRLVQFLLDKGADPGRKKGLAVKVAIRRKDLKMVRILVDKDVNRKYPMEVTVTKEMVEEAVSADARDIVKYLMMEKGCVPDIRTVGRAMQKV